MSKVTYQLQVRNGYDNVIVGGSSTNGFTPDLLPVDPAFTFGGGFPGFGIIGSTRSRSIA